MRTDFVLDALEQALYSRQSKGNGALIAYFADRDRSFRLIVTDPT
jgi:hypothetical protein